MSDPAEDRSSNIDFEDCTQCAVSNGSGICSNCEADGAYCPKCNGTGHCTFCQGTGRRRVEPDPELLAQVAAAGPLIVPDAHTTPDTEDDEL